MCVEVRTCKQNTMKQNQMFFLRIATTGQASVVIVRLPARSTAGRIGPAFTRQTFIHLPPLGARSYNI